MSLEEQEEITFRFARHHPEVERFHAKITRTHFPTHTHEGFVIGLVHAGVQRFNHRGVVYDVGAGSIIMINPEEVHSAEASKDSRLHYETLHVPVSLLKEVTRKNFFFREPVIFAPNIYANLAVNLRVLDSCDDKSSWSEQLTALLYDVGSIGIDSCIDKIEIDDKRLKEIIEYIEGNLSSHLSVQEMASIIGLSKYHFIRFFQRKVGVTPHAYVQARRAVFAKRILQEHPPSIAASLAGFVDQSHLNRWVKACYGTTPSVIYRRFRVGLQKASTISVSCKRSGEHADVGDAYPRFC